MHTKTPKQHVIESLNALPDEASFDDVMYRVYILHGINRGREDIAAGRTISGEELHRELFQWDMDTHYDPTIAQNFDKLHELSSANLAEVIRLMDKLLAQQPKDT